MKMNQNYLGELSHKPRNLPKLEKRGYTRIYRSIYKNELRKYLHNFWGVKDKNSEWGNTCENGSYKTTKGVQSTSVTHPNTMEAH